MVKQSNIIYKEMKAQVERQSGFAFNEGGDMALRLRAVAAQIESLWAQLDWTKNQVFPQTASGEFLELHGLARGISRGAGTRAEGILRFETGETAAHSVSIPAGTVCLNSGGTEFLTTREAIISAGESFCLADARARNPGIEGNAAAGTVCYMALAPAGIARCFNPEGFSGGLEAESDEGLRERILKSYESLPNGSNAAYYESAVLDVPGVAAVLVKPRSRGAGTVDIIVADGDGIPSTEFLEGISAELNAQREICVDIDVLAPTELPVAVMAAIELEEGFEWDLVQTAVETALGTYFDGKLLGKNILRAKLGNIIFNVPGVKNYTISQPAADILVESTQLPAAGTITITRS